MTNQETRQNRQLDDQIAEFTDRLLDKKIPMDLQEVDSKDPVLAELQKTVMRLAVTFESESDQKAAARRVKSGVMKEWQKTGEQATAEPFWRRWWQRIFSKQAMRSPARNRKTAYAFAFVSLIAIVIVVSVSLIFPDIFNDQNLTGTAFGQEFPLQALIIFFVIIGLVYLLIRNRR